MLRFYFYSGVDYDQHPAFIKAFSYPKKQPEHNLLYYMKNALNLPVFIFTLLGIALLISSCSREPEAEIELDFIAFTKPHGWNMEEIDLKTDAHESLMVRKQGMFSSGFITIMYADEQIDGTDWILQHRNNLNQSDSFNLTEDNFRLTGAGQYGPYETVSASFTQQYAGAEYMGKMYAFEDGGTSVLIMEAGSVIDEDINEPEFEIIRESFRILE